MQGNVLMWDREPGGRGIKKGLNTNRRLMTDQPRKQKQCHRISSLSCLAAPVWGKCKAPRVCLSEFPLLSACCFPVFSHWQMLVSSQAAIVKAGRGEVCCCTGAHTHRPTGSLAGAPVTPGSRDKDRHPPSRGREKGEGRRSGKGRGRGDLGWKEPRKKEDMDPGQRHRETSTSKDLVIQRPREPRKPRPRQESRQAEDAEKDKDSRAGR